jgi:curli biogenesis system outer membrane secretion channel CsgG
MNIRNLRGTGTVLATLLLTTTTAYAADPAAATQAPPAAQAPAQPKAGAKPSAAAKNEQLELDTTQITGHRGLPRVLYIVPWKRADADDGAGRPAGSLLEETLAPVDRTEFRRQLRYYDALSGEPAAEPAPNAEK